MPKNISNKKYLKLEEKYKHINSELENIKKTNMYFYANKMPKLIKQWLFKTKNNINILELKRENIEFEVKKITFIINTSSYNNIHQIVQEITDLMYINYEVFLLCTDESIYTEYSDIDQRIKFIKFGDLKEKNDVAKNINQVCNITNSEYIVYFNNFYFTH